MSSYVGGFAVGTVAVPATVITSPPVVVITAPTGSITESNPTVTWTYTSPLSRPQAWYRIAVEIVGGGIAFDTGRLEGTATSYELGFTLTPFITYRIHVGASDGISGGIDPIATSAGWDSETVSGEFTEAATLDNMAVGSVYEIAINGVGYMLADDLENQVERSTALLNSQPPGSNAPFSEQLDRYSFVGFADFTAGEGQLYLDRPQSNPSRYWYSQWVNPFEPGEISLNDTPLHHLTSTFVAGAVRPHPGCVVASSILYLQTGNGQFTSITAPAASPVVFSTGLAGSIVGVATDGAYWYVSDGASIRRNNTAANPGADWSTDDVTEIAWCTDRLAGLDTAAVPPNFTTFSPAGAEENPGGWQSFTGATLRGLCGGDGYIWFGVNNVDTGHIRAWSVGSGAGTSIIALTLPEGESVDSLYFYLGNVFASTTVNQTPYNRKIYRCVPSEGKLTPQLLVTIDGDGTVAHHRTFFAGRDRFVACTWPAMMRDDTSGIGVIDLSTSGYARWQSAGTATRPVTGVVTWAGDFGFSLESASSDGGFYGADPAADLHSGLLETSVTDLGSNIPKALDAVSLTTKPLNGSIDTSYSLDTNATFIPAGTMDGAGSTTIEHVINAVGTSFGFRVELTPNDTVGPVLKRLAAKMHPRSIADQVRVFPINCGDTIAGLNGTTIEPDSRPGAGIERVQLLEALVGQQVSLQDVNWPQTKTSKTFQVVATEARLVGAYDRNKNWRADHAVCVVTLRRPLS
jgi:hypothetical protein